MFIYLWKYHICKLTNICKSETNSTASNRTLVALQHLILGRKVSFYNSSYTESIFSMFNEITMCLICGLLDLKWSRSAVMFRYSRHCTLWAVAGASWSRKVTSLSSQSFWLCTNAWWDCFAVQWNKHHFWCVTAKSFMSVFLRLGTLTHNRATWENAESKARELFIVKH